jgi:hypothetical protein
MARSTSPMTRTRLAVAAATASVALAAPAAASAADEWQRLGPAPGGDSFAVIGVTPYVAYTSAAGVRVAKLGTEAGKWRKVGGAVRHRKGNSVRDPEVVEGPGDKPWLTWAERTPKGASQIRVARFLKGKWREVVGGRNPISERVPDPTGPHGHTTFASSTPVLAFLRGRAYVAYIDYDAIDTMAKVARLSSNGRRWQRVTKGLGSPSQGDPHLASAGGRLFLETFHGTFKAPTFMRFDASSSSWKFAGRPHESDSARFGGIVGFGGALYTLFAELPSGDTFVSKHGSGDEQWTHVGEHLATDPSLEPQSIATDGGTLYAAYLQTVNGEQRLSVLFTGQDSWLTFPQPTPAGSTVDSAKLAGAAGGGVWLLAHETTGGKSTFQLELFNAAE